MLTFVETRLFTRQIDGYLEPDEYSLLQLWLAMHPRSGRVIPGSGGPRKLRWQTRGHGKRGGLRVIYLLRENEQEIWMLTAYPKNVIGDLPLHILRKIREELDG